MVSDSFHFFNTFYSSSLFLLELFLPLNFLEFLFIPNYNYTQESLVPIRDGAVTGLAPSCSAVSHRLGASAAGSGETSLRGGVGSTGRPDAVLTDRALSALSAFSKDT